jgi:YbbR domain-containing protein
MRKLFLNNIVLKITALVIAAIMWYIVFAEITAKSEIERKVISDIRISILRPAEEEVLEPFKVKLQPKEVNLYVEGPKGRIENLSADNITAFVDISGFAKEGIYSLPVEVLLPDKIEVLSETPICRVELSTYKKVE